VKIFKRSQPAGKSSVQIFGNKKSVFNALEKFFELPCQDSSDICEIDKIDKEYILLIQSIRLEVL